MIRLITVLKDIKPQELDQILAIWLQSNIEVHNFIPKKHWINNYEYVKGELPKAK